MAGTSSCLTDEELERFLLGEMSAPEIATAQHHLDGCEPCRDRLQNTQPSRAARASEDAHEDDEEEEEEDDTPTPAGALGRIGAVVGVAVLLSAVLGAGTGFLLRKDQTPPTTAQAAAVEDTKATPPATTVEPAEPVKPAHLVIEGGPANVPLVIRRDGKPVHARTTDRRLELPPGEYEVALAEYIPNTQVAPARVTLKPGSQETVRVEAKRTMLVPHSGEPLSSAALVSRPAPLPEVHSWTIETRGPRAPVRTAAYSPDGKHIATASEDGAIRLWDANGQLQRILVGDAGAAGALAWSPDGSLLALRGGDGSIRLWDAASGTPVRVFKTGTGNALAWIDGHTLATGGTDNHIHLWDTTSGKEVRTLKGHTGPVRALALSADGKTLASGSNDHTVRLWPVDNADRSTPLKGHDDAVTVVAWSSDGTLLASGSRDGSIRFWDAQKGAPRSRHEWEKPRPKDSDPSSQPAQSLAWQPKAHVLASAGTNGVQLWKPDMDKAPAGFLKGAQGQAWAPDGKQLAVVLLDDDTVRFCDPASGKVLSTLPGYQPERVRALAWSADGKVLVTAADGKDRGKTLRLWQTGTGKLLQTLSMPTARDPFGMAVSFDGKRVAAVSAAEPKVFLWDGTSGKALPALSAAAKLLTQVAFSPDGKVLAAAGDKPPRVFLWDAAGTPLKGPTTTPEASVTTLAWSPDAKTLAVGAADGHIFFWDSTGKPAALAKVWPFSNAVTALAWSPDGKWLATAGNTAGAPVKLYESGGGGKSAKDLKDHQAKLVGLTFGPDGKTLIGRSDGGLYVWDVSSGQMRTLAARPGTTLFLPEHGVAAAMGPGGLRLEEFSNQRLLATLAAFPQVAPDAWFVVSGAGHWLVGPKFPSDLLAVVQTDQGQEALGLDDFKARYKWQNEPDQVPLLPPQGK